MPQSTQQSTTANQSVTAPDHKGRLEVYILIYIKMCKYQYEASDKAMQPGIPNTNYPQEWNWKKKIKKLPLFKAFKEISFIKVH